MFPEHIGTDAKERFLKQAHDLYVTDAYHSLSIEGYRVTTRVRTVVRDEHRWLGGAVTALLEIVGHVVLGFYSPNSWLVC